MKPLLTGLIGLAIVYNSAAAAEYYVSPRGADENNGTRARPFATLARARDAIRESGNAGQEPITVYLTEGVHPLAETLTLLPEDSGTERAPITYRAENEGAAILSGAILLEGLKFKPFERGIYKALVPERYLKSNRFDQLFLGDRLLDCARYPNGQKDGVFGGVTSMATLAERANAYADPTTAFVHALHGSRWGSVHYRVTGVAGKLLQMEGGWQQNRHQKYHAGQMMIENVFEELDAPGEWYLDRKTNTLFVFPPQNAALDSAPLYAVCLKNLISIEGTESEPVRYVRLQGVQFRHARRTFLDEYEPLLRGDWSIHRSGAVFFSGTEHCVVRDCFFNKLGNNGVFFSNYNRHSEVVDCRFHELGESAVCFVGNYACTRSNPITYGNDIAYDEMDLTAGPQGNDYPRYCRMEGCLVFAIGRVGKQTAGAFISMAENITLSHNTIFHVPRSGITINDGCWGGHVVEYNDVFDTVIETGDHGPFNSWGRDRYWMTRHHSGKPYRQDVQESSGKPVSQLEAQKRARLDNRTPTVIRNNRWYHAGSHSWGIDLDDGSSNYHLYNNLCLGCSVKLREGFFRRVENNILIGPQGVQLHVPFDHNQDTICRNIIVLNQPAAYLWRNTEKEKMLDADRIDNNLFWSIAQYADPTLSNEPLKEFQLAGIDVHSVAADPQFVDPLQGDFSLSADSPALKLGFKNFSMDSFGVRKPALRKLARTGHREYNRFDPRDVWGKTAPAKDPPAENNRTYTFLGATIKDLVTEAEKSVAGIGEARGVFVMSVPADSPARKFGLVDNDAILAVNGESVKDTAELLQRLKGREGQNVELRVVGARDRKIVIRTK